MTSSFLMLTVPKITPVHITSEQMWLLTIVE